MNKEMRDQKLEEAKQLVLVGWCQRTSARDSKGQITSCFSNDAVSFCASGAICRVMEGMIKDSSRRYAASLFFGLHDLAKEMGYRHAADFNDAPGRTVEEVAAFFDKLKERPYVGE